LYAVAALRARAGAEARLREIALYVVRRTH